MYGVLCSERFLVRQTPLRTFYKFLQFSLAQFLCLLKWDSHPFQGGEGQSETTWGLAQCLACHKLQVMVPRKAEFNADMVDDQSSLAE